jgi:uncharacterized protein YbjT (DUF2867 family)
MSHPMKLRLLQAITAGPGAIVVGAPKIPQMTGDVQDHDRCDWAAVLAAAAALGSSAQYGI